MSAFPMFVDLKGKLCVIIGGGNVAARKAGMLVRFGADIRIVSPEAVECIKYLKQKGLLDIKAKAYAQEDIQGAFLVIAATDNEEINKKIYEDAIGNNIPVNVVDCPEKCTFIFPSIVERKNLIVGISTSGSYPALAKNIRRRIEAIFPQNYGDIIDTLKIYREKALQDIADGNRRKELLNRLIDDKLFDSGVASLEEFRSRAEKIYNEYLIG